MTSSSFPDFVCKQCHEPVNKFTGFFGAGEVDFRHGRPHAYDHEVDPIPRTEATHVVQICDFCSGSDVVWIYHTQGEIRTVVAAPTFTGRDERRQVAKHWDVVTPEQGDAIDLAEHNMSEGWTACAPCAELVELRDMERLITRLRRIKPDTFAQHSRSLLRGHFAEFFRRIGTREPVDRPTGHEGVE